MRQERSVFQKRLLAVCISVCLPNAAFTASAGVMDAVCAKAVPVELSGAHRGRAGLAGEVDLISLQVPSPGILALDVLTDVAGDPARIGFLGPGCGQEREAAGGLETIERFAAGLLVAVREAGTYVFRLAAQDPGVALESYRLVTAFVASQSDAGIGKGENEEEDEPDPGGLRIDALPAGLCHGGDDHGDTLRCATPLVFGFPAEDREYAQVTGELENGWGDDEDVFVLSLSELRSVVLEVSGVGEFAGGLYDQHGQRLAVFDGGRIARTLVPGSYFVRIGSAFGRAQGAYELNAEVREW